MDVPTSVRASSTTDAEERPPLSGGGSAVLNGHGHRTLALPLEGKAGERVGGGRAFPASLSLGRKAQPASSAAAKMRQSAVRIRFIGHVPHGLTGN